jgi:hypothetical protein
VRRTGYSAADVGVLAAVKRRLTADMAVEIATAFSDQPVYPERIVAPHRPCSWQSREAAIPAVAQIGGNEGPCLDAARDGGAALANAAGR